MFPLPAMHAPRPRHFRPVFSSPGHRSPTTGRRRAFTLIELLTVIAIIGILAAIIIPITSKVRQSARSLQDVSNARQITLSLMLYRDENRYAFPDIRQAGNINGWIEKLRESYPSLQARDMFASPMDEVLRTDPAKEKRSYSINDRAVVGFNKADKKFYAPPNPSSMILLANYGTALSVISGQGAPSTGAMNVFGSDAVSKFHKGGKGTTFGFFDGHVEIVVFDTSKHYWGSPWHVAHWQQP